MLFLTFFVLITNPGVLSASVPTHISPTSAAQLTSVHPISENSHVHGGGVSPSNSSTSGQLAIQPQCGRLNSDTFANFNSGLDLTKTKTIVVLGDSWSAIGGGDGRPPGPATPDKTGTHFGGRASDGPVYSEDLLPRGATLLSYAVGGATVDRTLWVARAKGSDMVQQVDKFLAQHHEIDAASTIAIEFFGFNDYNSLSKGPGTMEQAASHMLNQTKRVIKAGIKKFIIISLIEDRSEINHYSDSIWEGFKELKQKEGIEFAYIDLRALWKAMTANPKSFGYESMGACLKSQTSLEGRCANSDAVPYWFPSHPSKRTHRLIADYIKTVLTKCGRSVCPRKSTKTS